jgi:membrane protein DedA with SNARE-associated domain
MISEIFNIIIDITTQFIGAGSYFGIFLLMAIESSFIPFPSEVILIPAGILVARGEMSAFIVFLVALLGSLLGALVNYYIGLKLGRAAAKKLISKYGKFFLLTNKSLHKSEQYFIEHGGITTLIGRLIPAVRQLISLPAGFSKMNLYKFSLFSSIGAGFWIIVLLLLGIFFGNNLELIEQNINLITLFSITISLVAILIYLRIYGRKKRKNKL